MNRLSLNVNKSSYMIFRHKNKTYSKQDLKLGINDIEIKQVSHAKFLGIIVDKGLMWKNHTELVCKKIMKTYGIIRRISSLVNRSCLLTLYYSLIYPYLSYCNIIWASTFPTSLHKLFLLQKKFIRLATTSSHLESSAPLFKQLKILSIFDINVYQICIFMFNCTVNADSFPIVFHNIFMTNSSFHSYPTRQSKNIHCHFSRTTLVQFSIKFRGPTIWNYKPSIITNCSSISLLKSRLKHILLNE